jgi:hypothetical protein
MPSYKEVHLGLVRTRMNCTYLGVNQSRDPIQIVVAVAKYTSSYSLFVRVPHLEGEEVFRLAKQKVDLPPRSKAYSHQHD